MRKLPFQFLAMLYSPLKFIYLFYKLFQEQLTLRVGKVQFRKSGMCPYYIHTTHYCGIVVYLRKHSMAPYKYSTRLKNTLNANLYRFSLNE